MNETVYKVKEYDKSDGNGVVQFPLFTRKLWTADVVDGVVFPHLDTDGNAPVGPFSMSEFTGDCQIILSAE